MDKKPSLHQVLNTEIMKEGYLTRTKVHAIAQSMGHTQSNAERRLRQSESPFVEPVFDEKNRYIIGYRYKLFNEIENRRKVADSAPQMKPLF